MDADGIQIRHAREDDRDDLVALLSPGWPRGREPCATFVDGIVSRLDLTDRLVLVAEHEITGRAVAWGRAGWWAPRASDPPNVAPAGLYLIGVNVLPSWRRRGIARRLTQARFAWALEEGASEVFYFANLDNAPSLALHAPFGFEELTRDFWFPGTFDAHRPMVLLRAPIPAP